MTKLEKIKNEIRALKRRDAEVLRDWLEEYLAELDPVFVESIERGNADIKLGRVRIVKRD